MASFSSHAQVISRGKGRSAVAAAAYRAGEKIKNEWDGRTHDYSDKQGVLYAEIFTPDNAPDWMHDRSKLWNTVEQIEKRKDAQLAREIRASLPQELTQQQNIQLARDYAKQFIREGMIADIVIHDKQDGNPHIHIMLTMRTLDGDDFGKKNRDWNRSENVEKWREQLSDLTNGYLERYGHKDRVDHRSYEEQGIEKKAKVHLSRYAYELEQKGIPTEKGGINRAVEAENHYREQAKQAIAMVDKLIQQEQARLREEEKARLEEERKVAGQGKKRKGEQPDRPLSFKERYMQEAERHKMVRSPEHQKQQRSYSKPQTGGRETISPHHSTDTGRFADRYYEQMKQEQQAPIEKIQQTMPNSDQAEKQTEKQVKKEFNDRYHERMKREQAVKELIEQSKERKK